MDFSGITSVNEVRSQAIADAALGQSQFARDPPLSSFLQRSVGISGSAPPLIAAVYTAQEFQDAFHEGIRDIEIHANLDLRNLSIPIADVITSFEGGEYQYRIGYVSPTTRSIRVCFLSASGTRALPCCT